MISKNVKITGSTFFKYIFLKNVHKFILKFHKKKKFSKKRKNTTITPHNKENKVFYT